VPYIITRGPVVALGYAGISFLTIAITPGSPVIKPANAILLALIGPCDEKIMNKLIAQGK
jgi:hypothetical protein